MRGGGDHVDLDPFKVSPGEPPSTSLMREQSVALWMGLGSPALSAEIAKDQRCALSP